VTDTGEGTGPVVVATSAAVEPGSVTSVAVGDLDLVVWRTASGRPCVMEARCPHQWSHLGAEGVVAGEEIVCTAHFWRFSLEGAGSKVGMTGRRDPKADIAVYDCDESGGVVTIARPTSS
jgi:phenylpropionate dioxygenase-like ring-hydroxylating dioxygenase large terminal subunit